MEEFSTIDTKQFRGSGFMTVSKYDNSGKHIYVGDKDSKSIISIETDNYNVIGSFDGHNGVVWNLDISSDDSVLISCSGDLTICFWDTTNGKLLHKFPQNCIPKYVQTQKNLSMNLVGVICEGLTKKSPTYILIYDLNQINQENFNEKIKIQWDKSSKPMVFLWKNETTLIIGCDDGKIVIKNILTQVESPSEKLPSEELHDIEYQIHDGPIKSMVWNKTQTQILTGSLDCTAKQIDTSTWEVNSTYKSTVPINCACWNHNDRKVLIGGGIEAMNIAKTANNDLKLKIYRTSDQKLMNQMSSHFGPIRYIDRSPCSKNFVTASQDGTVKIYFIKDFDSNSNSNELVEPITKININDDLDNSEKSPFKNFGSCPKYQLTGETNKIENLSWKPKPKVEKKTVWIPGLPLGPNSISNSKSNSNPNTNSNKTNYENKKESDLYGIKSLGEDTNERLYQIKKDHDNYTVQNCTIRVTNLPQDIQPKDLEKIFDLYGRIVERDGIKIKKYEDTTMAFIKYAYPESATKAIENLDNVAIDHNIIRIEYAKQK